MASDLRIKPTLAVAHLFTLCALAVSQPLYDFLLHEDHSTLLIANKAGSVDIWVFVVTLSLLLPLSLSLIYLLVRRLSFGAATAYLWICLFLSFSILISLLLKTYFPVPRTWTLALTASVAVTVSTLYFIIPSVRLFITLMIPAIIIVPLLFLANPTLRPFMYNPESRSESPEPPVSDMPHVVLIIFDELPMLSLLDEAGRIDSLRFPNFADLAKTSTWFRNTNTVHYATRYAIPSILTGTDFWSVARQRGGPSPKAMLARDWFPDNIFSLLEPTHKQFALLMTTRVDGPEIDPNAFRPALKDRLVALFTDLAVVFAHRVWPDSEAGFLPRIEGKWNDLAGWSKSVPRERAWRYPGGAPESVRQIHDSLHRSNQPVLYVLHVLLPHRPFRYNEWGQMHEDRSEIPDDGVKIPIPRNWWPSRRMADLSYQAHLLQLVFTDRLLGRLLSRLRELDLFDNSLVVLTADHGISFYWDDEELPADTLADIKTGEVLQVPLFIKLPGQKDGQTRDEMAQTIDILPTMADSLGVEIPWAVDGISLNRGGSENRSRFAWFQDRKRVFANGFDPDRRALKRKIALFGSGSVEDIYAYGPHPQLLGTSPEDWPVHANPVRFRVDNAERFQRIDPTGTTLPAYVEGELFGLNSLDSDQPPAVSIAVNGVFRATVRTWQEEDHAVKFLARVPPESFVAGKNSVSVLGIEETRNGKFATLLRFKEQPR